MAAVTICHKLGDLKKQEFVFSKSDVSIKVWAGRPASEGSRGGSGPRLSQRLRAAGIPWLAAASLQPLPLSYGAFFVVYLNPPYVSLIRTLVT